MCMSSTPTTKFYVPCTSKLLRQTSKKGVSAVCSNSHWSRHQRCKHLKMSIRVARAIQAPLCPVGIGSPHELELEGNTCQGDCCVFVFGLMWSPEDFVKQAVSVGHPFSCFQGCQRESRALVCVWQRVTHMAYNNRCSKLGEWLRLSKSFEVEEAALSLPCRKRGDEFWRVSDMPYEAHPIERGL